MNADEPTKDTNEGNDQARAAVDGESTMLGGDHVEVVVEDLFIEEYQIPLTLPSSAPPKALRGRIRARSIVGGLLTVGGMLAAAFFAVNRRRSEPVLHRWFRKLHIVH